MADRQYIQQLARKLADEGKLIEAGWLSFRAIVVPPGASPEMLGDLRLAFMAGSQHTFASMMDALDPGREPTEADMRRMDLIDEELRAVVGELTLRVAKPAGSG